MSEKVIKGVVVLDKTVAEKIVKEKIRHAKKAFRSRFKHELSDAEFEEITALVHSPDVELVMWQKGHGSVVKLEWKGFKFYAVYGHKINCIVTFLTLDMTPKMYEDDEE